jgi:hypothetical protein
LWRYFAGEIIDSAGPATFNGDVVLLKNAIQDRGLADYTVECDFKLDFRVNYGLFGIIFRGNANGQYYSFQWNGNNEHKTTPHWQVEKLYAPTTYVYLGGVTFGGGIADPVYSPGSWVKLKVECQDYNFKCYVDKFDGFGYRKIYDVSDMTFATGGVGMRVGYLNNGNQLHVDNFKVTCGPPPTRTPTPTPTITFTPCAGIGTLYENDFSDPETLYDFGFVNYYPNLNPAFSVADGSLECSFQSTVFDVGLIKGSLVSFNLSDYTVEADFTADNISNQPIFGLVFRGKMEDAWYSFQWNSTETMGVMWQMERHGGGSGSIYPGYGKKTPAYQPGSTVHLKVVCRDGMFSCYVDFNDGAGERRIYTVPDYTFLMGGAGVRVTGIAGSNGLRSRANDAHSNRHADHHTHAQVDG